MVIFKSFFPNNSETILIVNPKEVSCLELIKKNAKQMEFIAVYITMKNGTIHSACYGFDDEESRNRCFAELMGAKTLKDIVKILNATQRL